MYYSPSGSVSPRLARRAQGRTRLFAPRRARRAVRRLEARLDAGRNTSVLELTLAVASSGSPAADDARRVLVAHSDDVVFLGHLVAAWCQDYGYCKWRERRSVTAPVVLDILLRPAPEQTCTPAILLTRLLDTDERGRAGDRDPSHIEWARSHLPSALGEVFRRDEQARSRLKPILRTTDHPRLLECLSAWCPDPVVPHRSWDDATVALGELMLANPALPLRKARFTRVMVLKQRFDLIVADEEETADQLLFGLGVPAVAAGCARALRELPPGEARERLLYAALSRAEALDIVDEMGWSPADPDRRALFFFLHRRFDRYAETDPDVTRLHREYERAAVSTRDVIRRIVLELTTVRAGSGGPRPARAGLGDNGSAFDFTRFARSFGTTVSAHPGWFKPPAPSRGRSGSSPSATCGSGDGGGCGGGGCGACP